MNREEQIIAEIMDLVSQLGWNVLVPNSNGEGKENEPVPGLIIGTDEFIEQFSGEVNNEELH